MLSWLPPSPQYTLCRRSCVIVLSLYLCEVAGLGREAGSAHHESQGPRDLVSCELTLDLDLDSAARAQGEVMDGIRHDLLAGDEAKAGLLDNGGDEQLAFHQREVVTDADTRPNPEGDVGVARQLLLTLRGEACGIEHLRLREVFWSAVQGIGRDQNVCSLGYPIAINRHFCQHLAKNAGGGWIEAHGFFENLQAEREPRQILKGRAPSLKRLLHFLLHLLVYLRLLTEEIPAPGQSRSGGFVTGAQENDAFVQHLAVAHRAAVLILSIEQHGEQIKAFGLLLHPLLAPLLDHLENALFQKDRRGTHAAIIWRGPVLRQHQGFRELAHCVLKADRHGRTNLVGLFEHIDIEEYFADDAHGQADHLLVQVDRRPVGPLACDQFAVLHDGLDIIGDVARLKHRDHQFALFAVKVALADKETIALDGFVHKLALGEIVGMLDQDGLDVFGLVEKENRDGSKVKAADIADLGQLVEHA